MLFGSFTEEDVKLFQIQSDQKTPGKISNKADPQHVLKKPEIELQFGTLDIGSLNLAKGIPIISKQALSVVKPKDIQSPILVAKDAASSESVNLQKSTKTQNDVSEDNRVLRNGKPSIGNDLPKSAEPESNGTLNGGSSTSVNYTNSDNNLINKKLIPRGLINLGNLCFLNSTLQALLSCSPFVQLLRDLAKHDIPKVGYPTLQAFVMFINDFGVPKNDNAREKKQERAVETGMPFSATMFNPVLDLFTPDLPSSLSGRPRQEDAQEFLSFIMDRLHNELLKLEGNAYSSGANLTLVSSSDDDGWETVGPKNKTAVTRTQSFIPSELSAIFGGQLRSTVKSRGNKASATVQPYLLLHLDILSDAVHTIEDALHIFSAPESLEGYKASAGKAEVVSASKSLKIQKLSKILILHLMRFSYGYSGSKKLHKPVHFPLELVIARDLLVNPTTEGRKYELVSTITHHGQQPNTGHYTTYSKYTNGQWLRYDDQSITAVSASKVLHDQAYLLFYKQL